MEEHGCLWPSDVRSQWIYSQGSAQVCLGIIRVQYEGFTFVYFPFNSVFFILTTKVLRQDMFVPNMLRRSEMTIHFYVCTYNFIRSKLFLETTMVNKELYAWTTVGKHIWLSMLNKEYDVWFPNISLYMSDQPVDPWETRL